MNIFMINLKKNCIYESLYKNQFSYCSSKFYSKIIIIGNNNNKCVLKQLYKMLVYSFKYNSISEKKLIPTQI